MGDKNREIKQISTQNNALIAHLMGTEDVEAEILENRSNWV